MRLLPSTLVTLIVLLMLPLLSMDAAAQVDSVSPAWEALQQQALWYGATPVVLALLGWLGWLGRRYVWGAQGPAVGPVLQLGFKPLGLTLVVLAVCLAGTTLMVRQFHAKLLFEAQMRFQLQTDRLESDIQSQLDKVTGALRGVRATVVAHSGVTRDTFHDWVASRQLEAEFAGVRGFGLIDRVARDDVPAYVSRQRSQGAPDFAVRSKGEAPDLFIIKVLEPLERNRAAIGFDVGSEPVRRAAAERAMREGQPALTGRITLVQDTEKRAGFLFYVPIYKGTIVPDAEAARVQAFQGWAYAPIVAADFLAHTLAAAQELAHFQLFDGLDISLTTLVYDSDRPTGTGSPETVQTHPAALFTVVRPLILAGTVFQIRTSSTVAFENSLDVMAPARAALAGSALSVLASLVVCLLMVGRVRAAVLARTMTQDIQKLSMVAQRTSSAVIMTDVERRITWVNEAFTRISGYTSDEVLGKRPGELLQSPNTSAATIQAISQDLSALRLSRQTILNRHKNGHEYWLDLEIQPTYTASGNLTGYMAVESDVTEMVHAREALAAEKVRVDNILAGTNVGTWEWNAQTKAFKVNERFIAMMGFTLDEALPDVWTFWKTRTHPDDWVRATHAQMAIFKSQNSVYACDTRIQRKDGSWMWVLSRGRVMSHTADGRVEWVGGIHTDVSDIKANEERLRDAETFLDRAGRIAGLGAWQVDLKTNEVFWNDQTREIHGVAPGYKPTMEEALSFYPPESAAQVQAAIARAVAQCMGWDLTTPFITAEGDARWVRSVGEPEFDDSGAVRLLGAFMDVTVAHQSQVALQESKETAQAISTTLQSVLDSAVDVAIMATDLNQTLTVFNQGAERLLGYSADELVGTRTTGRFFEPIQMGQVVASLAQVLGRVPTAQEVFSEVANNSQDTHWTFVRKDGSHVNVSLLIAPMRSAEGTVVGYLGIARDITQQEAYEDSLRHAKLAAEQSSVAKSQFLANMSHEIRTPMNAILGMLALLHNTPLSDRQRDYADKTESAAKSLLVLLNDILDFSKVEAGKLQIDPHPFLVDRLLADLSVILSANLGDKDLEVLFDVDPAIPPSLVGDALRIKQILINLGGNAVKFTAQGQVVVQLRLQRLFEGRAQVEIAVRDSGIGIAPENQARIFEGFSQAEASTTRKFGGTGLGLVISQRLIGLMGGELALNSTLGQGSTFSFVLDLPVGELAAPPSAATQPEMHVLLVDDNAVALATCAAMMESLGWHVAKARSGAAALQHVRLCLRGEAPALAALYVDWQMPDMDGWQTLREVRRLYGEQPAPVMVMLSGQGRELLAQRTAREQELLNGFLVKPLTAAMFNAAYRHAHDVATLVDPDENAQPNRTQRLGGMRILVVEDNLINQQVAQELLSKEGALITLAGNGRIGVDTVAAAQPQFDAVLMDLQMPVMDGLSAAAAIRGELSLHALPIIAMTANAMASDREACLQAGMNDHVGKPFDLNHLVATLVRFTHWSGAGTTASGAQLRVVPATVSIDSGVAWPEGMDGALALARLGGNVSLFASTVLAFAKDAALLPARVQALTAAADAGAARRELHAFKGLAATLGLMDLSLVAAQAERLAMEPPTQAAGALPRLPGLPELLVQIGQRLQDLLPELLALAARLVPAAKPEAAATAVDSTSMLDPLRVLLQALRDDDMVAMELHAELPQTCGKLGADAMTALDAAMADMDFVVAAAECERLMQNIA